ncbi:hypothetical protein ACWGTI_20085 [Mesorhizobium sp. ArgA1]
MLQLGAHVHPHPLLGNRNANASFRWTPHPSRRCAPIRLLPQGEKEKIHRIDCANVSITLSFPEIRRQSGRETHREERLQALSFIADNG